MLKLIAAVILTAFASAHAEISPAEARLILDNTNAATLLPVLRSAGYFPQTSTLQGDDVISIRFGNDVVLLRPRVCNEECRGLLMFVVIEGAAPAQVMNAFNQQTPATVAYTSGNATVLSRYLIADHGITAGSFLVNLDVFARTVQKWTRTRGAGKTLSVSLLSQSQAAGRDPEAEALIADVLTRPELVSGRIDSAY